MPNTYQSAAHFDSDPANFLPPGDMDAIRGLAGLDEDEFPDARLQALPLLPVALAEARRRAPTDWEALPDADRQWLRLALQYHTAALAVGQGNLGRTDDFKIGSFAVKTDDAPLLADAATLMGYADQYYASVTLPGGVVATPDPDSFPRPMMRVASVAGVGRGRLY